MTIFSGGYGSGKSELAVNTCLRHVRNSRHACLIDLDILKPMFRSRTLEERLIGEGSEVVSGVEGMSEADTPTVSPRIGTVLTAHDDTAVIIDIGGDGSGATILGRYSDEIKTAGYGMYLVINPYRPFIRSSADIKWLADLIENRSRLTVKGVIANPNLGSETTLETLIDGLGTVRKLCVGLPFPIVGLGAASELVANDDHRAVFEGLSLPVIPVTRYLLTPWEV